MERITGEALSEALLSWLKEHDVDVAFCRGQGYDGASNMSSCKVGVQARIREVSSLALYSYSLSESSAEPLYCQGMFFASSKKCQWHSY